MKLNSKYFDSLRSKRAAGARTAAESASGGPRCQWKGCTEAASHRAPVGRGRDGEYFAFCLEHVRSYNASYNYFDGMSDADVRDFQKDAVTGHRPTWKTGSNAWAHGRSAETTNARFAGPQAEAAPAAGRDPHGFFAWRARQKGEDVEPTQRRQLRPLERKALDTLHLSQTASREEIKARFKELVKRHHPDINGGDKGSEDKLREIIQAYNYLKQASLV